jgi:hypothetical protein
VVWRVVTRIMTRVGDLLQRSRDDRTGQVLGGRTIRWSDDAVCDLHHARGGE